MSVQEHSTATTELNSMLPNKVSEYRPTSHFIDAKKWRNVHGWIIQDVIENGTAMKAKGDKHKLVKECGGFEWWFIVKVVRNGKNKLLSCYVPEFEDCKELYDKHFK